MQALVVAGGGMRSAYACGALLALQEAGVKFDSVYGSSAGGAAGAWFAQGRADGFVRTFEHARDPQILNWRRAGLRRGPYLDLDYLVDEVYPQEGFDGKRLRTSVMSSFVTATTMTGRGRYLDLRQVDPQTALKATMRLPFIAGAPLMLDGVGLVDGGVTDPLPVARAIRDGHKRIILVLNRPEQNRRAEPRSVAWLLERWHPQLGRLAAVHHRLVMDALRLAEAPPEGVEVQIVRPSRPTGLTRFTKDLEALRRVIAQGKETAHRVLDSGSRV